MIATVKTKSKFDKFILVLNELNTEFRNLENPKLVEFCNTYISKVLKKLEEIPEHVKRSEVSAGFEQGLRGLPDILSTLHLPQDVNNSALIMFHRIVELYFDNFFTKDKEILQKVLARAKIKNESEFYIIRNRVDEIEGQSSHEAELSNLYKLLDDFEKIA